MDKVLAVIQAVLMVMGALSVLCAVLANALPDGKAKTAFSYAGGRLVKAIQILRGALPAPAADAKPEEPKS